ncbi:MAG: Bax inhibitor-1/YccA family protein [Bacteroidetes bacterium]|nr:MAG: Bax inhibitor-1/YccA family protein [Bacteroidota bacterium]
MARRNFLESNNPMLKDDVLRNSANVLDRDLARPTGGAMTIEGAVNKTYILFAILVLATVFSYTFPSKMLMWAGFIGIPVLSFLAARNLPKAATFAPLFSIALGLMAGSASYVYSFLYDGIIFQAVTLTFSILFTMLTLYKSGMIKVTDRLRNIISIATGAIMVTYLVSFVVSLFGGDLPFLHDYSPIGIGISLVIVGVASFKLLVDFDNYYKAEAMGAPAYMEWYVGMGLMFTLVWLYMEILYLLSALSRD